MTSCYYKYPSIVLELDAAGVSATSVDGERESRNTLDQLREVSEVFRENKVATGVKIFSSGSHLDPKQFPPEFIRFLLDNTKNYGIK